MSTAIAGKRLSKRPVEQDDRQRARQSKAHPDCRSTTIKSRVTKISLALSPGRDNHPLAATAKMAILIVAVFPSRLSRYIVAGKVVDDDCVGSRESGDEHLLDIDAERVAGHGTFQHPGRDQTVAPQAAQVK